MSTQHHIRLRGVSAAAILRLLRKNRRTAFQPESIVRVEKGGEMVRGRFTYVGSAVFALWAMAAPASAQVTTGTLSGTVKDPQGGIIPGAAVTLTSDTRGTKLSDVFTNEQGNSTFLNA